ncbi:MAG: alkaline phosphatase family protein [Bacteroidota bacterium]
MSARLVVIALDGADGGLVDRWSADGTLPALAALRARGASSRLSAPPGITDDGLWASFQYASGLGDHGRYHWRQRSRFGAVRKTYLDEDSRESFWNELSRREGHRVAVLDIPKCGRPRPLDGIHLADWLVHGRYARRPLSMPETLAEEVVERFGEPPPSRCGYEVAALSDPEVEEVTGHLRTSVGQKRTAGLHYLASEPWDLFMIGFKEAHCAGHHLWDLADAAHPEHDAERAERLGHPLRQIYRDLDAAVGDLIEAAGDGAKAVVFATTEMEPNGSLVHLMPEIVRRMNRHLDGGTMARMIRRIQTLSDRFPAGWPCEILPYNENCTALRVGPPPLPVFGYTRPNEALLDEIEAVLRDLVDVDTGRPVVAAIDRPSTREAGPRAVSLPDLLVRYEAGTFPRAVASSRLGVVEADRPDLRPGDHAPGGFLIGSPAVTAGVQSMQDIGPMAARVLRMSPL